MGVVCFRFVDKIDNRKIDMMNSAIVERVNASGRAYLTQTKLNGRTVMHVGLGNVLTTEEHLRNVWELIQQTAGEIKL
jgi:aromatic-L-amino-acid decarboxylase